MNIWQFIQDKQAATVEVMLLCVLESKGSSPGRQGFKMAVAADSSFCGSIGGGIMEHKFVEMARAELKKEDNTSAIYKQVHDKDAVKNQSGMICSGEQTLFIYQLQSGENTTVTAILKSLQLHQNGTLILSPKGIQFFEGVPEDDFQFTNLKEGDFIYREKTGFKNSLHIVGGGHCALALSKLMFGMDFHITLYDDRPALSTWEQNECVHEKKLLASYDDLKNLICSGTNVYVVIMTFGYRTDDLALKSLLGKQFRYIGMLGSKTKMDKMCSSYKAENKDEMIPGNLHAPVGIQIKSKTPEEIAVSIAAEIIAEKNKLQ